MQRQPLRLGGGGGCGRDLFDFREAGDHPGIEGIGFFQQAHAFGEAPQRAGIHHRHRNLSCPEQREGEFFVFTAGFHRHQSDALGLAEAGQSGDASRGVGERESRLAGAETASSEVEEISTPQMRLATVTFLSVRLKSGDCSVVRAKGDGPNAALRL